MPALLADTIDLGYRPREWQDTVHRGLKRFSVLVVHRRGGKTVLSIMTLLDAALRTKKSRARYAYVAPFRNQAKAIAWDYLKRYGHKIPGCIVNEGELWIELPNGAQIRIYGADNADALRGIYLDGVVLDEVADMRADVWGEILRPALSDRLGWALFIGTPKGMNVFSELYFSALSNPDWYAGLFTVYDTKALPEAEINANKAVQTEQQFAQEYLCDFAAGNTSTLLTTTQVQDACLRVLREDEYNFAAKVIGVDVARQGDDRTAIFRRQGLAAFKPIVLRGADAMTVAGRVAQEYEEWKPDAVFVDGTGGYGAGVIDRLRSLRYTPTEVQFGGLPLDPRYANKRAEMWWLMAEWVKGGGLLPNIPEIKLDLCTPMYGFDGRNKLKLESKDDIKKRGIPSPDMGDALALTFAYPVSPASFGIGSGREGTNGQTVHDYDPFR